MCVKDIETEAWKTISSFNKKVKGMETKSSSSLPTTVYLNRIAEGVRLFCDRLHPDMPNVMMLPSFADLGFAQRMAETETVASDLKRAGGTWQITTLDVATWMNFIRHYKDKVQYIMFFGDGPKQTQLVPMSDFAELSNEQAEEKLKTIFP